MSSPSHHDDDDASTYESQGATGLPTTHAAFSPVTLSANTPSRSARRSNILVHQKSPLLVATPPQVTRALAYSHPFLLPLNKVVGLLTWSTGDSWQSFLLLSVFWFVVLYGDVVVRRAGPVVIGIGIIAGMYGRRYSPLSSSSWAEPKRKGKEASSASTSSGTDGDVAKDKKPKHQRAASEITSTKHQKTLDEIVETLKEFTGRCNVLMEPLLEMTDFLSTQRTPTSATTKPALTAMFVRLLIVTPFWLILTMAPLHIITTRRVVLVFGSIVLTWHARPLRVTRTLLWRSSALRRLAAAITGLRFDSQSKAHKAAAAKARTAPQGAGGRGKSSGVKFTFIIYENQRRWVGLGWTASLFAYERAAWTDEHNNPVPSKDEFELPDVEDGSKMRWDWVEGSRWRVDGVSDEEGAVDYDGEEGKNGWIYYDNKWQYGRRGTDGWAKWTRRRKWYRDAELVEADGHETAKPAQNGAAKAPSGHKKSQSMPGDKSATPTLNIPDPKGADDDSASVVSSSSRSSFWPNLRRRNADKPRASMEKETMDRLPETGGTSDDPSGLDLGLELGLQQDSKDGGRWGIGDEARMNLE